MQRCRAQGRTSATFDSPACSTPRAWAAPRLRSRMRPRMRAAIVDTHLDLLPGIEAAHLDARAERQCRVRRGQRIHVEALSAGGTPAVKPATVPGCRAAGDFHALAQPRSDAGGHRSDRPHPPRRPEPTRPCRANRSTKLPYRPEPKRWGDGRPQMTAQPQKVRPGSPAGRSQRRGPPASAPHASSCSCQAQPPDDLCRRRTLVHAVEMQARCTPARSCSHRSVTTSRPKALMDAVSSPKPCRRRRIQRGISAPQASLKRISWLELAIGMMPGTTGAVTPKRVHLFQKTEVGVGVVKVLGDGRVGTGLHLGGKRLQVALGGLGLRMGLRVGSHLDVKVVSDLGADKGHQVAGVMRIRHRCHNRWAGRHARPPGASRPCL